MEVLNPRSALLSNYEVLTLLRELESDYLTRTTTALRIKKEEESSGHVVGSSAIAMEEISENLRTVEVEAIRYLAADFQPAASQSPEGITQLLQDLAPYEMTKAEKLQVVNLAPVEPVELYVIVEELEDRFPDQMEDILSRVKSSLKTTAAASAPHGSVSHAHDQGPGPQEMMWEADAEEAAVMDEIIFDDTGEGAGVEGDLDVEDD